MYRSITRERNADHKIYAEASELAPLERGRANQQEAILVLKKISNIPK